MAERGAQPGNTNQSKSKPWADAIRRALARREQAGHERDLNYLAEQLLDIAGSPDHDRALPALKELGDRLDGKPHQTGEIELRGSLTDAIESLPVARCPSEAGTG